MKTGNIQNLNFSDLITYENVINTLKQKNRNKHLLMGNGFSMAYDPNIFSYNALYKFIEELDNEMLLKLFKVINTKNFELVMQQLDNFIEIANVFNIDKKFTTKLEEANDSLKNGLIEAISSLHPEHVFEIPEEKSESCARFLADYLDNNGFVFTTNYDLLMYWVLLRNNLQNASDGFGREMLNPEDVKKGSDAVWSDLYWGKHKDEQKIFYLHGTLSIFDTGVEIEKEVYTSNNYLLENIKNRLDNRDYPIFVTAGNGREKLEHIMHNRYLINCYEQLSNIEGSLVTFGFNFGKYDEHIIEAINKASNLGFQSGNKLYSIYIGVYSESDLKHIQSIENKFMCKVNVYNAKTANIWG